MPGTKNSLINFLWALLKGFLVTSMGFGKRVADSILFEGFSCSSVDEEIRADVSRRTQVDSDLGALTARDYFCNQTEAERTYVNREDLESVPFKQVPFAPKVLTISVAAYNVATFLSEALESCIVSNMDILEVIIVDDGSLDESSAVAQRFVDEYPDTFKLVTKKNGGYGSTFNTSLELAQGKYFRYLDGDDWFDKVILQKYLSLLQACETDVIYTPYNRVYEEDGHVELRECLPEVAEGVHDIEAIAIPKPLAACSLAYRTSLLRDIGFTMSEHCFYTDVEYAYLPFAYSQTITICHDVLYCYRIGREGQSVSVEGIKKNYQDIIRVCTRLLQTLMPNGKLCEAVGPKAYIRTVLAKEAGVVYTFLCIAGPEGTVMQDLIDFEHMLYGFPEVYNASATWCKKARLLRMTCFAAYPLICRFAAWKAR